MLQLQGVMVQEGELPSLKDCSLTLHEGEILGIAGVAGNGQLELAESVLGLRPYIAGQIIVEGTNLAELDTRELLERGIRHTATAVF